MLSGGNKQNPLPIYSVGICCFCMGNSKSIYQRKCGVEGCGKKNYANGFCKMHDYRIKVHGNINIPNYKIVHSFHDLKALRNHLMQHRRIAPHPILGTQCWEWTKGKITKGYGHICIKTKTYKVHRISAHIFLGFDIHSKKCICHTCDNPSCFNPEHLWIGTYSENMLDMYKKSRGRNQYGEKNSMAKLTENKIRRIRLMLELEAPRQKIASIFNVNRNLISLINRKKIWNHI